MGEITNSLLRAAVRHSELGVVRVLSPGLGHVVGAQPSGDEAKPEGRGSVLAGCGAPFLHPHPLPPIFPLSFFTLNNDTHMLIVETSENT